MGTERGHLIAAVNMSSRDELGGGYIAVSVSNKADIVLIVAGLDMTQEADKLLHLYSGGHLIP
ncbi:hypothetical protein Tco_1519933, partial [Tanacetum coccineum]